MINSITKEQEDQIEVYLKKWLDIGYRTETMDEDKAKKAVEFFYTTFLKIDTPEIHFVKSPMEALILCNKIVNGITPEDDKPMEFFEIARSNWWMSYYAFGEYLLDVIFPEKTPEFTEFKEFIEHSKNIHLLWTFDQFAVVCDFPSEINLDNESRLHNNLKGSLIYRDGYSLYSQDGEVMTKEDWLEKTKKFHSKLGKEIFKTL
jgi:hypothetical protein